MFRVLSAVDSTAGVSAAIPIGAGATAVRVTAAGAQDARVRFGDNTATAGLNDTLIKTTQSLTLAIPQGATHIAVLSAASLVNLAFGNEL